MHRYVHGYSERETERLYDQSRIMEEMLHSDTAYPAGRLRLPQWISHWIRSKRRVPLSIGRG